MKMKILTTANASASIYEYKSNIVLIKVARGNFHHKSFSFKMRLYVYHHNFYSYVKFQKQMYVCDQKLW